MSSLLSNSIPGSIPGSITDSANPYTVSYPDHNNSHNLSFPLHWDSRSNPQISHLPDLVLPNYPHHQISQSPLTHLPSIHPLTPEPLSASSSHSSSPAHPQSSFTNHLLPSLPRPRRSRREKPHIDLAPDQPPTTQGKARARVYVACLQCRNRKIRCDGAKPVCHNCGLRTDKSTTCTYDPLPKRRGPDKTPGARQRTARDLKNQPDNSLLQKTRRRRRRDALASPNGSSSATSDLHSHNNLPLPSSLSPSTPSHSNLPSLNDHKAAHNLIFSSPHLSDCNCQRPLTCHNHIEPTALSQTVVIPPSYNNSFSQGRGRLMAVPFHEPITHGYITQLDDNGNEQEKDRSKDNTIAAEPSLDFTRKIWWDSLLSLYSSPTSNRLQALTHTQRDIATQGITSDLRFLFRASNYWFYFFHIPSFFGNFYDPDRRERLQPSLVLSALALSTFWQSSELGDGAQGRERSLRYRDEAQSALDASLNAGWIDETLAQAAWILALFEVCAHPTHSAERSASSMVVLDSIIRSLSLTMVDADDPQTSTFHPRTVPTIHGQSLRRPWSPRSSAHSSHPSNTNAPFSRSHSHSHSLSSPAPNAGSGCSCRSLTLAEHWAPTFEHVPLWASTPAWNSAWSEAEIRKESCRRLCWATMMLAAGHNSYGVGSQPIGIDLFTADPSNYALLFSGESIAPSTQSSSQSSKYTIWALYERAFLLWHACLRMRNDVSATDAEKAQFAVTAWLETDVLEEALNTHTCGIERAFIFNGREYLFNTRMCISYEFQRFIPLATADVNGLFHRKKAEDWLSHQESVALQFMHGLHTITGHSSSLLALRPFFVFWFMGQISRSLALWHCDNTLTVALDVCKAFLPPIDYLTALWPCPEQRYRYEYLRERLDRACYIAGVTSPPPPNLTLPPSSSPHALI